MSTLILGCLLSGAAGFLAGWWKGRGDFASDLDDDCGDLLDRLKRVTTSCTACGSPFVAGCPNRCGPSDSSGNEPEKG